MKSLNAILACSAAILLSACGGSTDTMDGQQALATTVVAETAQVAAASPYAQRQPDAAIVEPALVAADGAAPADTAQHQAPVPAPASADAVQPVATVSTSGNAGAQATDHFALSGYGTEPPADGSTSSAH